MMVGVPLCVKRCAFVIEHHFRMSSYKTVQERYANEYGEGAVPKKSTIKRIVKQFCTHGATPLSRSHPPRVLTPEKLNEIQAKIDALPSTSAWKLASQSKALEQHKCGHTPFLITRVVNKLYIPFIPMIISYGG